MSEQSDTPRTDAFLAKHSTGFGMGSFTRDLERELATATRERDEWEFAARNEAKLAQVVARERDEARAEVAKLRVERDTLKAAAKKAEAALADIGDSDHEPTDDLAWCEQRAQEALPVVRFALAATEAP